MNQQDNLPKPGEMVLLVGLPLGFLDDLPEEEQKAIREMVGKPVKLGAYDELGRAELFFGNIDRTSHTLYLETKHIQAIR
jgi:hypothetical protein